MRDRRRLHGRAQAPERERSGSSYSFATPLTHELEWDRLHANKASPDAQRNLELRMQQRTAELARASDELKAEMARCLRAGDKPQNAVIPNADRQTFSTFHVALPSIH